MRKKIVRPFRNILVSSVDDFIDQMIIIGDIVCSFNNDDIRKWIDLKVFPSSTIFKLFDSKLHPDFMSHTWLCFPEYPFTLGLKYHFFGIVAEFFKVTKLAYVQTMPIVWRVQYWIDHVNRTTDLDISLPEIARVYDLQIYGSYCFLFKVRNKRTHLTEIFNLWPRQKRVGTSLCNLHILVIDLFNIFSWFFFLVIKFNVLVPPARDTERKIKRYLNLPAFEITLKASQLLGPKSVRASGKFSLADLEKKSDDKILSRLRSPVSVIDLTHKVSGSKRKFLDLQDFDLGGDDAVTAVNKVSSYLSNGISAPIIMDQIITSYKDMDHQSDEEVEDNAGQRNRDSYRPKSAATTKVRTISGNAHTMGRGGYILVKEKMERRCKLLHTSSRNIIAIGRVHIAAGRQLLNHKPLPQACYKVSIDKALVEAACIPDIPNNVFKTINDVLGFIVAWPKDQVIFFDAEKG
ncbi:hypothetical protein OROMI_021130 [Orobanche minor]